MNRLRPPLSILFLVVPAFFVISCANQIPPTGGPIDTVPPTIVSTYPAPYTLHFKHHRFDLEFDKYVDHRSVEESIFISPYVGDLEFDWSGKEVEVTFSGELRENTTYVINVGTDVKDLRSPANRMAQAFTLAFSTGGEIDRGGIRGRIFPAKSSDHAEGVMIFAYQLADLDADTLDPRTLKPDYITQTGKNGDFYLQHLSFGPYRIFAVRDEYRNLLYDPETDEFGVPSRDFVLAASDSLEDDIHIRLASEDTTAPRVIDVDPKDSHHLLIEFSESIDTSSAAPIVFSIADSLSKEQLKIHSLFPILPSLSKFIAVTDKQDSAREYRLTVLQARDLVGIPVSARANAINFAGSRYADTLAPKVSATSVADSSRNVVLRPVVLVQFSDAVQRQSLVNAIVLSDSSGKAVPISLDWLNDASCRLKTLTGLSGKTWYNLTFLTQKALGWSGTRFTDSLKVTRFETLDAEALSSIEGVVFDADTAARNGKIIVTAEGVDQKNQKSYSAVAMQNGNFMIPAIEEGRYVVYAFRDRNMNERYDAGRPFPFVGSERFAYAPDTLKVRARWPLEGVRIDLR